jgi:hypothetical protein
MKFRVRKARAVHPIEVSHLIAIRFQKQDDDTPTRGAKNLRDARHFEAPVQAVRAVRDFHVQMFLL